MGSLTRKQISFDIDTTELRKYYPKKSWRDAYKLIKEHMLKNDFKWIQGSVYTSKNFISVYEVMAILGILFKKYPYFHKSIRDIVVTEVGEVFSLNFLLDRDYPILPKNELENIGDNALDTSENLSIDEYLEECNAEELVETLLKLQEKFRANKDFDELRKKVVDEKEFLKNITGIGKTKEEELKKETEEEIIYEDEDLDLEI